MSKQSLVFLYALLALTCAVSLGWTASAAGVAAGPDDDTILLVAQPQLKDSLYSSTIIIAKPLPNGQHVGFILNKPTKLTLGQAFPEHEASKKIAGPLFLGGPSDPGVVFALVQRAESPGPGSLQLMPGLFLAFTTPTVDRIIETEADHARFFAGLVVWKVGELNEEVKRGVWYTMEPDAKLVLKEKTDGLWEQLVRTSEAQANMI
jgi:putative transcriptional regulator